MASNTLTGNGISGTYPQILHVGTGSSSAATIRLGDGTATCLSLVSGGFKVTGTLEATGDTTIGGTLSALGVPVFRRVTSDVTAATTTQVNIAEFDFTPVAGAVYHIAMHLMAMSAATTTGAQIVNSGGAGTLLLQESGSVLGIAATGGTYAPTSAPVAWGTAYGIHLEGVFIAGSSAPLKFDLKSEVAASTVALKAGSILKITRIS
jgi:hypothetical protein